MRVGIVGGGQLARMLIESASALGIQCVLLAESDRDAATQFCTEVIIGSPKDSAAMQSLADRCDVVTFDHELVDLEILAELAATGTLVRPGPTSLLFAVDKAAMRVTLGASGLPMPRFVLVEPGADADLGALGDDLGWPLVIKAARGGYDGRGVYIVDDPNEAARVVADLHTHNTTALLEEHVVIISELAALVARNPSGDFVTWPVVETAQVGGVCREVLVPGSVSPDLEARARSIAERVADVVGVEGVMAVELFETSEGLVINELAMRPHNSGHWTQDGSVTSQFQNHLRSVLDLPLGSTEMTAAHVASVNVFGSDTPFDLDDGLPTALLNAEAHVHLYGKSSRPGRKLGHVTATGADALEVRRQAWKSAIALGTPVPDQIREVQP